MCVRPPIGFVSSKSQKKAERFATNSECCNLGEGRRCPPPQIAKKAEHLDSETLALALTRWSPAVVISESRGRKPKRKKFSRYRSHQQRAFAAGVLHSIHVYEGLTQHEHEIRSMLFARGLIDERALPCATHLGMSGVRPDVTDVGSIESASSWLDNNSYVPGYCRPGREHTDSGHVRVRLTNDGVATGRGKNGLRVYVALEQLLSWTYFWANTQLELRWLGLNVGFGVFATRATTRVRLEAVVDYDLRDPHTTMMVRPTVADRKNRDLAHDYCSIYGPLALVNAACEKHSSGCFRQADLGQCGKLVMLVLKPGRRLEPNQQLFASYSPPDGQTWRCEGLQSGKCRLKV